MRRTTSATSSSSHVRSAGRDSIKVLMCIVPFCTLPPCSLCGSRIDVNLIESLVVWANGPARTGNAVAGKEDGLRQGVIGGILKGHLQALLWRLPHSSFTLINTLTLNPKVGRMTHGVSRRRWHLARVYPSTAQHTLPELDVPSPFARCLEGCATFSFSPSFSLYAPRYIAHMIR